MKNIILIGPKHCGKTSAGKALALLLFCDFIDLDEEMARITGKTPRQLYTEGVEIFQKAEEETIKNLTQRHSGTTVVIATGGGIVDNQEAVSVLKSIDAIKIYLNISAAAAWQRISGAGELPPFLQTDNPQETHRILHERRAAGYQQLADISFEAEEKTPQYIADKIAAILSSNII